jgi:nitric oxide reductase subunit C
MRKQVFVVFALVVIALMLAACGGGGAAPSGAGGGASADAGKAIFAKQVIGAQAGCVTCHSLEAGKKLVGPSMAGLASRAGSTVSGKSAEAYIRQAILEPNAHVVADYPQGVMQTYAKDLKEQELNDLVAYLLTLK